MSLRTAFSQAARPAAAGSGRVVARASARTSYRQYSSNAGNGSSNAGRNGRAPIALSLLGLGSVGGYFGLTGSEKDPKTTQEGMRKEGSTVDYQQVGLSCFDL